MDTQNRPDKAEYRAALYPLRHIVFACAFITMLSVQLVTPVRAAPDPPPVRDVPTIASNFTVTDYIGRKRIPPSAAPDVVGAFRFICGPGPVGKFDPIVYPGQQGAGHLHQFFGNTAVATDSTYDSLRTAGDSTCNNKLNRSAYWIPALLTGTGFVLRPREVAIYYKRRPATDPECASMGDECVAQPDGLRWIMGYNVDTGKKNANFDWICRPGDKGPWQVFKDLEGVTAGCPGTTEIHARVHSVDCWDGRNLDSPDHRSHMAQIKYGAATGYKKKCPATHPKIVPVFTLSADYIIPQGVDISMLSLSSDAHAGTKRGGSYHMDLWDAWDGPTKAAWTANCIDKLLNCSDGDLGNGSIMTRGQYYPSDTYDALIPVPSGDAPEMAHR